MTYTRDVHHAEFVLKGLLLEVSVPSIGDFFKDRSPKTIRRGLWSTAKIRLLQQERRNVPYRGHRLQRGLHLRWGCSVTRLHG